MQPEPKKHVSHVIAWSLIALFAGSLAFGIWMYSNQIDTIYSGSVNLSVTHKKTTAKPTTATTGTTTTGTTATSATAEWKTYTNTKYSYSVKYPNDWEYTEQFLESKGTVSFGNISKPMELEGGKYYPIAINYHNNPNNLTWDKFFDGENAETVEGYSKKSDTKVGGKAAINLTGVPGLLSYTYVIIPLNKAFIVIQKPEDSQVGYGVDATYSSMLSTFTFTK